jgi:penicillin-binding protein 1A
MAQSIRNAAPAAAPVTRKAPDPEGPIEPLDLPDLQEMPIDIGDSDIRIDQGQGVTVTTDVGGVPLEIKLDRDGANIQAAPPSSERPAAEPR